MYSDQAQLNPQAYAPDHIAEVVADLQEGLELYLDDFGRLNSRLRDRFKKPLADFDRDHEKYSELFARDALDDFAYDPAGFKNALAARCPNIHNALYAVAEFMKDYKEAFRRTGGARLLEVTTNIVQFARAYANSWDGEWPLPAQHPADLRLAELDTEPYTAFGVIGGGIRSEFLYQLFPSVFPNRSRRAIWALYFLVGHNKYGFTDESEFLMVERDGSGTQQNYYYPYDLFTYYAQYIMQSLEQVSADAGYPLLVSRRYVYLDALLDFIAREHESDISTLMPQYERNYY